MVHRCGLLQDRCSPTPHSPSPQTLAHRFARHTYRTHYYYSRTARVDRPESRHESRPVTLHHALSCRARLGAQASNGVAPIYQLPPVSGDLPSRRRHHHRHVRGTGTCGSVMVPFLVYVPPRQDMVTLGTPVTTLAEPRWWWGVVAAGDARARGRRGRDRVTRATQQSRLGRRQTVAGAAYHNTHSARGTAQRSAAQCVV